MSKGVLAHLRRRLAGFLVLRVVLALGAALGLTAAATILLDAVAVLPDGVRAQAPWLLGLCAAATILAGVRGLRRMTEARVAREFERKDRSLGSVLINAVQLSSQPSRSDVEEALRLQAVEMGRRRSGDLPAWPIARRGVGLSGLAAALTLFCWSAGWLLFGDLCRATWPRFLDPYGDHPPYSRLRIDVKPGDTQVLYGGQCEIRAVASGRPVDELYLMARGRSEEIQTVMFLSPDRTFFQTLANLREETEYFVTDGRARSRRFKIGIQYTPRITLVQTKVEFPEYTHLPPRNTNLTDEVMCLPEESRLTFRVASNRPLSSGTLTLTPILGGAMKTIPLKTDSPASVVTGGFTLAGPVAFGITVTDVAGLVCAEPRKGRVNVLPDNRPQIFVLEPGRHALATPDVSVPVRVQAEDDYAVTQVPWFRGLNKSIERSCAMKLKLLNGPRSVEAVGAFNLRELGVRPGDEITYFFEAVDNCPKGPNLVTSRVYSLRIISTEQYMAIMRRMAAQQALFETYDRLGEWLRRLSERAEDLDKQVKQLARKEGASAADQEAVRKEAGGLAEEIARYEDALAKELARAPLFDIESAFRRTLESQQDALARPKERLDALIASGVMTEKDTDLIARAFAGLCRSEKAEIGEPVRLIKAVVRVVALADAFVIMAQRQAEVVRLAERFKEKAEGFSVVEQMELQEIAHSQVQVRDALKDLVSDLPQRLADLPNEAQYDKLRKTANDFLHVVNDLKIPADLDEAAGGFSALDGKRGFPPARRAAENMDKLIKRCHAMPGAGQACLLAFRPTLTEMGNTLEQILAGLAGRGEGAGSADGYSLSNQEVGLYGPNFELPDRMASGRGAEAGEPAKRGRGRIASDAGTVEPPGPKGSDRVKLQRDVKFPLQYRNLVGEYFRVVAESQAQ